MFTISLTDILASYTGDTQTFEFRGVVPKGYFSDIEFLDELVMRIKLVTLDEAVEVVFESITSKVRYDGSTHAVAIL